MDRRTVAWGETVATIAKSEETPDERRERMQLSDCQSVAGPAVKPALQREESLRPCELALHARTVTETAPEEGKLEGEEDDTNKASKVRDCVSVTEEELTGTELTASDRDSSSPLGVFSQNEESAFH